MRSVLIRAAILAAFILVLLVIPSLPVTASSASCYFCENENECWMDFDGYTSCTPTPDGCIMGPACP